MLEKTSEEGTDPKFMKANPIFAPFEEARFRSQFNASDFALLLPGAPLSLHELETVRFLYSYRFCWEIKV